MTTINKLILAVLVTFGHEMSLREMAELTGIPRETFKRKAKQMIRSGLINSHLQSLKLPLQSKSGSLNGSLKDHGYAGSRAKVGHQMGHIRESAANVTKKGDPKVGHQNAMVDTPTGQKWVKGDFFDFGTDFAIKDISTNNIKDNYGDNSKTVVPRGVPLREQNAKTPHTKLRSHFDLVHFKTHSRDASFGKHNVANAQAKELFKKGLNLFELKRAVDYFHTLNDDWVLGHTWAAFYGGAYHLVDASKKTGKFVKLRPDLDRDIKAWLEGKTDGTFSDIELEFIDECKGARPKDKADSIRFSCLKEREETAREYEREKDEGFEPESYLRYLNQAKNTARNLLNLTGDKL